MPEPRNRTRKPASDAPAPPDAPPAPQPWYVVSEVIADAGGLWLRVLGRTQAGSRYRAIVDVVGVREGRFCAFAESNSEVVTFGPPPDPDPALLGRASFGEVIAEPLPDDMGVTDDPVDDVPFETASSPASATQSGDSGIRVHMSVEDPERVAAAIARSGEFEPPAPEAVVARLDPESAAAIAAEQAIRPALNEESAREGQPIPIDPDE